MEHLLVFHKCRDTILNWTELWYFHPLCVEGVSVHITSERSRVGDTSRLLNSPYFQQDFLVSLFNHSREIGFVSTATLTQHVTICTHWRIDENYTLCVTALPENATEENVGVVLLDPHSISSRLVCELLICMPHKSSYLQLGSAYKSVWVERSHPRKHCRQSRRRRHGSLHQ